MPESSVQNPASELAQLNLATRQPRLTQPRLAVPGRRRGPTLTLVRTPADTQRPGGSNLTWVRDHNQLLVMHAIRTQPGSTRRSLAQRTGLTFQTVNNICKRLIDAALVVDVPAAHSIGRSRALAVRPAGAHAVGIEIAGDNCTVSLVDLAGAPVATTRLRLPAASDDAVVDWLIHAVPDLMDDAGVPVTTVLGGGLTVERRQPADDDLRSVLESRLRMPVFMVSGVVAGLRQQQWSGSLDARDLLYVHLGEQVECAIVSHGRLCTGARGRSGEIAHVRVDSAGSMCHCGRRGCLATVLADRPLREALVRALGGDAGSDAPPTLEQLLSAAGAPQRAVPLVNRAAHCLSRALRPAVQLLDPAMIVIGGPTADALGESFSRPLARRLRDRDRHPAPVVLLATAGAGGATRTATAALHQMFTPSADHLLLN